MYVRWVVRRHKNEATANVVFYDSYLVESFRDERNSPRQRTLCYLGNIRQIDGKFPTIERELFLLRAEQILANVPAVAPEAREHVMQLLRRKVPPLTHAEVHAAFANHLRWYYHWRRLNGDAPSREELLRQIEGAAEGVGPV